MSVRLSQLRKTFVAPDGTAVPVIDIDDFELSDNQQAALIGTSGSGKTTLLHLIAGILAPDAGQILFDFGDSDSGDRRDARSTGTVDYRSPSTRDPVDLAQLTEPQRDVFRGQNIGYIFQTHHLLPGFTALENVLLGMSFTGRPGDPAWAKHLLKEVALGDRLNYKPAKLSVGQQQRVAVARALANRPKVVLADEPTGALDYATARTVLSLIRNLCQEVGASLLMVTHDLDLAGLLPRKVSLIELNRAAAKPLNPSTPTVNPQA